MHKDGNSTYYDYAMGKRPAEELYNLAIDPECLNNLSTNPEYSSIKQKLWNQLKTTLTETQDPRILGRGEVFDGYEYLNHKKAKHSWHAYEQSYWKPQTY